MMNSEHKLFLTAIWDPSPRDDKSDDYKSFLLFKLSACVGLLNGFALIVPFSLEEASCIN